MNKRHLLAICATTIISANVAIGHLSAEPLPPGAPAGPPPGATPTTPDNTPRCADTCGYAVVDTNGVVHGVIVCQEGCFGGTMPNDYMGCPAGCSLVLQAPKDANGNVAGIHGPEIIYNPTTSNFERTNPDTGQIDWSLPSGQPLENAYIRTPVTVPAPDTTTENPEPSSVVTVEPELAPPTTQAPNETTTQLAVRTTSTPQITNTKTAVTNKPSKPTRNTKTTLRKMRIQRK